MDSPVLFFDGECVLCNGTVARIIKVDKKGIFRFSSLQSEFAKQLIATREDFPSDLTTFVLLEGEKISTRSDAALAVCKYVPFPHNVPRIFWIVPRFIRDAVYNLIARNRTKWFGRQETCTIYPEPIASRFLD